jgi:hypothetical protein
MTNAESIKLQFVDCKTNAQIAKSLMEQGFCTHYPGYTCDKDFSNGACYRCILGWLRREAGK